MIRDNIIHNSFFILSFCLLTWLRADLPEDWTVNPNDFEHNFTITAQLSVHDTLNQDSSKTIAAFINEECRGLNQPIQVESDWLVFLMVYGNAGDSEVHFRYYDSLIDSVFDIEETLAFVPNESVGTPDSPFVFHGEGINMAPVADMQELGVDEDNSLNITLTAYDSDGDDLTYAVVSNPSHGSLSGTGPELMYTPNPDYNGNDSFTFIANDGELDSEPATIILSVNPVNDAPVANAGEDQIGDEEETIPLDGTSSFDVDNDELTYLWLAPDGITLDDLTSSTPEFVTPSVDEDTEFLFILTVSDAALTSAPDTVMVTVMNNLTIGTDPFPTEFKLFNPYPNPFNPSTTIRYSTETSDATSLYIYDINGRIVETLVQGEIEPGTHKIYWNASQQPSGLYFVRLESGSKTQTQKLILLK